MPGKPERSGGKTLIIGVGNLARGDDAAGLLVARRLMADPPEGTDVRASEGDPAALMASWEEAETLILVDAVQSGVKAGVIHRIEGGEKPLPAGFFHSSTHSFGMAEAIELARALGRLPRRVIVYGIEGKDFEIGSGPSLAVRHAVDEVVSRIHGE